MAKKKNRKNKKKVIQLGTSVNNLIRSRARKLELYQCYISTEWQDSKEANIVVSRKHTNGNITFGIYLVDLALLGVKDVFYEFNEPLFRFEELIEGMESQESNHLEKADYNLVHNVIYGAVEYADDYGFKPHKNFAIGKYILEEDTDNIPLIDIDFGMDGLPTLFASSERPMLNEIKQLERMAGEGNFNVFYDDENNEFELDDDFIEEENDVGLMPGWDDDIEEMGVLDWDMKKWGEYLSQDPNNFSFRVLQFIADSLSYDLYLDDNFNAFDEVLGNAIITEMGQEKLSKAETKLINKVDDLIDSENYEEAHELIKEGKRDFPNSLPIYLFSFIRNIEQKSTDELDQDYEEMYKRFPNELAAKCLYATWQLHKGNKTNVPIIFENKFSLKELYPYKKSFNELDVVQYCSVFLEYFLEIEDVKRAEPYYQILDTFEGLNPIAKSLMQTMVMKKVELLSDEDYGKKENNLRIVR